MALVRLYSFVLRIAFALALIGQLKACTLHLMGKAAAKHEMMSYAKYTKAHLKRWCQIFLSSANKMPAFLTVGLCSFPFDEKIFLAVEKQRLDHLDRALSWEFCFKEQLFQNATDMNAAVNISTVGNIWHWKRFIQITLWIQHIFRLLIAVDHSADALRHAFSSNTPVRACPGTTGQKR